MAKFTTHPFLLLYHLAAAILGDIKMQYAILLRGAVSIASSLAILL